MSVSDYQYTERTHHGSFFSYRISREGETFAEFMARSPYYSGRSGKFKALDSELRKTGHANFGWSYFTFTKYQARISATVFSVESRRNDSAGNPRWIINTDAGTFFTESGASVNYGINNMTNSRMPATYILNGEPVILVLSPRGTVRFIEREGRSLDK